MIPSSIAGLCLENDKERALFSAAALEAGLFPVIVARTPDGKDWMPVDLPVSPSIPSRPWYPCLIVTDTAFATGGFVLSPPGSSAVQERKDSILQMLLADRERSRSLIPLGSNGAEIAPEYAWVIHRPLRLADAVARLAQAARASRVFFRQQLSLTHELSRNRQILDSVTSGVLLADAGTAEAPIVYVNPAFERLTGYSAQEALGRNCRFLQGADTDRVSLNTIRDAIRLAREVRVVLKNYRRDGSFFWNELHIAPLFDPEGSLTHFLGIQTDVTARVTSSQQQEFLSLHDALTGLANRALLLVLLQHALLRARRNGSHLAVLSFDLSNFKQIRDGLGKPAGDSLLKIIADRLRAGTRSGEIVAFSGETEFVAVLENLTDQNLIGEITRRLTSRLREAINLSGQFVQPDVSVGTALFPRDGDTPDSLLKAADLNMYAVRREIRLAAESLPMVAGLQPSIKTLL